MVNVHKIQTCKDEISARAMSQIYSIDELKNELIETSVYDDDLSYFIDDIRQLATEIIMYANKLTKGND